MVHTLEEQRQGLLETLALLDSMLSNAPIGFAFLDRELRYVRVNEFLANLHDLPIVAHLGRRPTDVYPASIGETKLDCLRQVFETGVALRNVELSGEMPDAPGVRRSWIMHFYPVRTAQDAIRWVGVIVVEITDQLRAEEALRKTEKLAAAGRLAASIAHEINNPLEAVTNLLYLLRTHDDLDETASHLVATAEAELARVSEITQQTLRFYRQSTLPSRVNLADILNSILLLYQSRITSAAVAVREEILCGAGGLRLRRRAPPVVCESRRQCTRRDAEWRPAALESASRTRPPHRRAMVSGRSRVGYRYRYRHVGGHASKNLRGVLHHQGSYWNRPGLVGQ